VRGEANRLPLENRAAGLRTRVRAPTPLAAPRVRHTDNSSREPEGCDRSGSLLEGAGTPAPAQGSTSLTSYPVLTEQRYATNSHSARVE
jgi:hypothetical protein